MEGRGGGWTVEEGAGEEYWLFLPVYLQSTIIFTDEHQRGINKRPNQTMF